MKSNKVKEIINECKERSLSLCKDLSIAQFSYNEVVDLVKMSNLDLNLDENHNLDTCEILLKYLENNTNIVDWSRCFYPDEVTDIISISELENDDEIQVSIQKFKATHK